MKSRIKHIQGIAKEFLQKRISRRRKRAFATFQEKQNRLLRAIKTQKAFREPMTISGPPLLATSMASCQIFFQAE